MSKLNDIIFYILKKYPAKGGLHFLKLVKLIYLADWFYALNYEDRLTKIIWYFDNTGPYSKDIIDTISDNKGTYVVNASIDITGSAKLLVSIKDNEYKSSLSLLEEAAINHTINNASKIYEDDFIKLIYSTYPIASSERFTTLNLKQKAIEYKEQKIKNSTQ